MMYKNLCFTFVLVVTLIGGLTSCTEDLNQPQYYDYEQKYLFDSNGVPYRQNNDGLHSPDKETDGGEETIKGPSSWGQIFGYDWEPIESRFIFEDGSTRPVKSSDRLEMNICYQSYYILEDQLVTTFREVNDESSVGTTYTEQSYYSSSGDIYADNQTDSYADNFRLRILEVIEYDNTAVMYAIEPLCIEYYGDDDEGRIIYGETTFQRKDHYKQ